MKSLGGYWSYNSPLCLRHCLEGCQPTLQIRVYAPVHVKAMKSNVVQMHEALVQCEFKEDRYSYRQGKNGKVSFSSTQQPLVAFCPALAACNRETTLLLSSYWWLPRQSSLAAFFPRAARDKHPTLLISSRGFREHSSGFLSTMVPGAHLPKWSFWFPPDDLPKSVMTSPAAILAVACRGSGCGKRLFCCRLL